MQFNFYFTWNASSAQNFMGMDLLYLVCCMKCTLVILWLELYMAFCLKFKIRRSHRQNGISNKDILSFESQVHWCRRVKSYARFIEEQSGLDQWCTHSAPRAKSGPRRVAMWPAESNMKLEIQIGPYYIFMIYD